MTSFDRLIARMMRATRVLLFACFCAGSAFAAARGGGGSEAGNGGLSVVCRDSMGIVQSVELLDYFEGKQIHEYRLDRSAPNRNWLEIARAVLLKLKTAGLSEWTYNRLSSTLESFKEETAFFTGSRLADLDDGEPLLVPEGCKFEQIAIQRVPSFPGERYYSLNADLWNHPSFDEFQKAGLALHEVFYRAALEAFPNDGERIRSSRPVRHLVARYSDPRYPAGSVFDLATYLKTLKFGAVDYRGMHLIADTIHLGDERIRGGKTIQSRFNLLGSTVEVDEVSFYSHGALKTIHTLDGIVNVELSGRSLWLDGKKGISFARDESLEHAYAVYDESQDFSGGDVQSLHMVGKPGDRIELYFDSAGYVSGCRECAGRARVAGKEFAFGPQLDSDDPNGAVAFSRWLKGDGQTWGYTLGLLEESQVPLFGEPASWKGVLYITSEGKVTAGTFAKVWTWTAQGVSIRFKGQIVADHSMGIIRAGQIDSAVELSDCSGKKRRYLPGMKLVFGPTRDGSVCVSTVEGFQ